MTSEAPDEFAAYRDRLRDLADEPRRDLLRRLCVHFGATLPPPGLLSTAQVAAQLGQSCDTLEKWRTAGTGPRWIRIVRTTGGRSRRELRALPRYRTVDVEAWIEAQAVAAAKAVTPKPRRRSGRR